MRESDSGGRAGDSGRGKWAAVNLALAVLLLLAIAVVRLHASFADAAGIFFLSAIGLLALVCAGFLFRSLIRR